MVLHLRPKMKPPLKVKVYFQPNPKPKLSCYFRPKTKMKREQRYW